jgi:alcohol dehydrogenase class IV
MNPFNISHWPNRIVFGTGAVETLHIEAARLGVTRALIVCGASVARGEMLSRVRAGLGDACAGVFANVAAQNPLPCIQEGADLVRKLRADAIVSVGGGSAVDAGKCIAMLLASRGDLAPFQLEHRGTLPQERLAPDDALPHIAVPTTAGSASEVMPTAGCRDPQARKKLLFWDAELVPKVVVLDPRMATFAPPSLTAHSGMTAVARCIEALYSANRQPLSTGLALRAVRLLKRSLPRSIADPTDLDARAECQLGSIMSGIAAINAMVSVVHAIGHTLGGRFGMQHGAGHAILLAPAMQLLLPAVGSDQFDVYEAMVSNSTELPPDVAGERAASAIAELVAGLPLPKRLRDCGINDTGDLDDIATAAMNDYMMATAPRPVSQVELLTLLRSVW